MTSIHPSGQESIDARVKALKQTWLDLGETLTEFHENTARIQAEAEYRQGMLSAPEPTSGIKGLAAALPEAVQIATGVIKRVAPPRILETDVASMRRKNVDTYGWLNQMYAVARQRPRGRVSKALFERAGQLFAKWTRLDTPMRATERDFGPVGVARATWEFLAKELGCCQTQVGYLLDAFEAAGLMKRINVYARVAGVGLRRTANALVILFPGELPEPDAEVAASALKPLAERSVLIAYLARVYRMAARPWGLNTTPLRPDRPAPA